MKYTSITGAPPPLQWLLNVGNPAFAVFYFNEQ